MKRYRISFVVIVGLLVALGGSRAFAQEEDEGEKPWAVGVSEEDQAEANRLFREANTLLKDSLFVESVTKYRAALEHWNHPAIHYNLALALMNLDQPINVFQSLEKAMIHGADALGQDKFEAAQRYQKLVEKQIAKVEISCDEAGVAVILDGKQVFTSPGSHTELVRIGEHTVVARKQGYVTQNETRMLGPGDQLKLDIKMYTPEDMTRYRRKWPVWKPYAVVGGGAAVVVFGGIMHALAKSGFSDFDDGIRECGGCVPSDSLQSKRDGARTKQTIAIVSYVIGAAVLGAGGYLAYMNRAQPYRVDLENQGPKGGAGRISVTPTVSPDGLGVQAGFRF
jgi:hypothetical protein